MSVMRTATSRSGEWKGSGSSKTAFTTLNKAVLAPIASAKVTTAIQVKAGFLTNIRNPNRKSCSRASIDESSGKLSPKLIPAFSRPRSRQCKCLHFQSLRNLCRSCHVRKRTERAKTDTGPQKERGGPPPEVAVAFAFAVAVAVDLLLILLLLFSSRKNQSQLPAEGRRAPFALAFPGICIFSSDKRKSATLKHANQARAQSLRLPPQAPAPAIRTTALHNFLPAGTLGAAARRPPTRIRKLHVRAPAPAHHARRRGHARPRAFTRDCPE